MSVSPPAQRTRRLPRVAENYLTPVAAMAAAIMATLSAGEPTGATGWDAVLKAVLAAAVVFAGSKAPRSVVIAMASIAAAFGGFTLWGFVAWVALAVAIGAALLRRRSRLVGAAAAGLAVQTLLRLPPLVFFGFSSLVAGFACALVLVGGYRYATRRQRQFFRRSVAALTAVTSIVVLIGSVSLLNARSDIDTGVAAARRGLEAARSGDTATVTAELSRAEAALESANTRASSASARVLRAVPVVAQHQRAIETATAAGAQVARDAASAVVEADFADISLASGSVDLVALRAMAPRLRQTANSLESALDALQAADSPWILPPLEDRITDLSEEIEALLPEIALAADATETVPSMLGLGAPDTYFVIFGTPAESRELGGFIGSWALLRFDNGQLQFGESGRITELYGIAAAATVDAESAPGWFLEMARPTQFPQNLTSSPDFATVAELSRQVLGGVTTEPLSGFIYLDSSAIVDMLEITGPVQIPFETAPLSVDTGAEFFHVDQYRLDSSRTEIFDTLALVANTVVERMRQQTLPGPEELGRILGPAARGGHLQVVTFDDAQNDFLRSAKLLRDFGQDDTADFVGLVQANALSNKMDLYLQRDLNYRVQIDEAGLLTATATATLRSNVPDDAPEFTLGTGETRADNQVLLSLYSSNLLQSVTVDGVAVDARSATEFGLGRYLVDVTVPPTGQAVVVEYTLAGSIDPKAAYSLEVWRQPLVNSDTVDVLVEGAGMDVAWSGVLVENVVLPEEKEG